MKLWHGILTVLLMVSLARAAPIEKQLRFWKPIDRATTKEEEIVAPVLDSDVYAATRNSFPDLRVIDEKQAEVPCQIEAGVESRDETARAFVDIKIVSLRPEGNTIEVRVRLPDSAAPAEGLAFATPLTNYERKVRISGSADGETWTPLTEGIIFDYSQYMDVNNREIALPKNNSREFKVTIEDVIDESESPFKELGRTFHGATEEQRTEWTVVKRRPFRVDHITAWHTATRERIQQPQTSNYPIAGLEVAEDAAAKQTIVTVRARREPITSLTLETPGRNFSRRVVVETPVKRGDKTEWMRLTEGTLFNFSFRNQHQEQLSITFPEQREEQFRVVIRNEDNPPISVTGVNARGNVYRVLFLAQPEKTYRVFYGSPTADAPKYEAATVLATLRRDFQPVIAALGSQTANTAFGQTPAPAAGHLLDNWVFLGTALGLMVLVLGWALFRAGKRLNDLPHENADQP